MNTTSVAVAQDDLEEQSRQAWPPFHGVSFVGKCGMVACWYYDGNTANDYEDRLLLKGIIRYLPKIVARKFDRVDGNVLWDLWDALDSYPARDDELEALYQELGPIVLPGPPSKAEEV